MKRMNKLMVVIVMDNVDFSDAEGRMETMN